MSTSGSSNRRVSNGTSRLAEKWRTEGKFRKPGLETVKQSLYIQFSAAGGTEITHCSFEAIKVSLQAPRYQ